MRIIDAWMQHAAAKIADMPLHQFVASRLSRDVATWDVPVYARGGYPYPDNDIAALSGEIRHFAELGFTHAKIKTGSAPLLQRVFTADLDPGRLPALR
jgi:D(-)-tartrate dehydratase